MKPIPPWQWVLRVLAPASDVVTIAPLLYYQSVQSGLVALLAFVVMIWVASRSGGERRARPLARSRNGRASVRTVEIAAAAALAALVAAGMVLYVRQHDPPPRLEFPGGKPPTGANLTLLPGCPPEIVHKPRRYEILVSLIEKRNFCAFLVTPDGTPSGNPSAVAYGVQYGLLRDQRTEPVGFDIATADGKVVHLRGVLRLEKDKLNKDTIYIVYIDAFVEDDRGKRVFLNLSGPAHSRKFFPLAARANMVQIQCQFDNRNFLMLIKPYLSNNGRPASGPDKDSDQEQLFSFDQVIPHIVSVTPAFGSATVEGPSSFSLLIQLDRWNSEIGD